MQMNNPDSTVTDQLTKWHQKGAIREKTFPGNADLLRTVHSHQYAYLSTISYSTRLLSRGINAKMGCGTYGAHTTTALSNPNLPNTGNYDWGRDESIITSNGAHIAIMGFEKNNSLTVYNHCYGVGLFFFYGYDSLIFCTTIAQNSPLINANWDLTVEDGVNPLIDFETYSPAGSTPCVNTCQINTGSFLPAWYTIRLGEYLDNNFTGHNVWGIQWSHNEWETGDGNLHYQTVDGTTLAANPPQMYWHIPPSNSGYGGYLWSCDYDSGTTCQLGS